MSVEFKAPDAQTLKGVCNLRNWIPGIQMIHSKWFRSSQAILESLYFRVWSSSLPNDVHLKLTQLALPCIQCIHSPCTHSTCTSDLTVSSWFFIKNSLLNMTNLINLTYPRGRKFRRSFKFRRDRSFKFRRSLFRILARFPPFKSSSFLLSKSFFEIPGYVLESIRKTLSRDTTQETVWVSTFQRWTMYYKVGYLYETSFTQGQS